jgi:hypothetical protein
MQTWLSIEEFAKLIGKTPDEIRILCEQNKLSHKIENDKIYIEANAGTQSLIPVSNTEIIESPAGDTVLEKTIATILNLHERVLEAKDETISTLQGENEFLKDTVISVQEIYDEDRKTIDALQKQIKLLQEELEYCRKKYKLMWKKAINKEGDDE